MALAGAASCPGEDPDAVDWTASKCILEAAAFECPGMLLSRHQCALFAPAHLDEQCLRHSRLIGISLLKHVHQNASLASCL